jgi:hypothetical protein
LGIILQSYVEADLAGHLSNEVRLSPTKNQWKYEIERPNYIPHVGLNSKDALFIDSEHPITITEHKQLKNILRMVGRWINEHVPRRTHVEWCLLGKTLWLVQLDTERASSQGIDPRNMPAVQSVGPNEQLPSPKVFTLYEVATPTPWRKLQNVADFSSGAQVTRHRLYFATGADVLKALNSPESAADLCKEIDDLTNHRAVVRTELLTSDRTVALNLPRTQTVSGAHAVEWIQEQLPGLVSKVDNAANVCFILHGYIPARASAWSYFQPGADIVEVDALWGLPDGLQFLPHDSFQVDAKTGRIPSEKIRCKLQVLQEQDDGSWRYVSVARQYSRYRSLSRRGVSYIAQQTVALANRINERTQIMWFCDIPAVIQLGDHLPWYRSATYAERTKSSRPPFRTFNISTTNDIERFRATDQKVILRILPEADLVRDESFLDAVIALAKEYSAPVELAGSLLGHAYYRLRNADLMVFADEPYAALLSRARAKSIQEVSSRRNSA